jgi:hypothetical protein
MSQQKQDINIKIHGIELISFSIQPQPIKTDSKDIFDFDIRQEHKTNAEKKLLIVFTYINIRESGKEILLANLNMACGFEIPFFESIIRRNKEGDYIIPNDLNATINRISIATSRGFLSCQLRGTYLQRSTLPLLPVENSGN